MIYEVYKQMQGKAGGRQLQKADLGITHNLGGRPGSFTCRWPSSAGPTDAAREIWMNLWPEPRQRSPAYFQ